jgi:hypothetical protein
VRSSSALRMIRKRVPIATSWGWGDYANIQPYMLEFFKPDLLIV